METLKINLNEIKQNEKVEQIKMDDFTITTNKSKKELVIYKDENIIAEYKNNNGWYFSGKSVNAIWETLQNHFDAIQKIIKELQK